MQNIDNENDVTKDEGIVTETSGTIDLDKISELENNDSDEYFDQNLRLQCVKIVYKEAVRGDSICEILKNADLLYNYVKNRKLC